MSNSIQDRVSLESESPGTRHLQEVIQSSHFERAPVLSGLLTYLWENRDVEVSEYAIAVEALGRKPDFESKIDATVRVQISRLRRLLGKYYESDGKQSPIKLVIPLGTHGIRLVEEPPEAARESNQDSKPQESVKDGDLASRPTPAPVERAKSEPKRLLTIVMAIGNVVLLCALGVVLWQAQYRGNSGSNTTKPQPPDFWKSFSNNGKSIRLVLPAPTFFTWGLANGSTFMARDISVNDFTKYRESSQIAELEQQLGKPGLWQQYTVLSDTFAALQLIRFFDGYGIRASISNSAESPQGIIEHENLVAFGTTTSLGAYQSDIDRLSYKLGPHEEFVIDKRLPPGSKGLFPREQESGSRSITPGLVAYLPRGSSGNHILILQGSRTMALVTWLTSEDGLHEIAEAQAAQNRGPYFEGVVLCEVNGENPIQCRMVAFRPVDGNAN